MNFLSEYTRALIDWSADTLRQWNRDQTPKTVERAREEITSKYLSIDKKFVVTFVTPSATIPGKMWIQKVRLLSLPIFIKKLGQKKTPFQIVTYALAGDILIYCNCPAFLFWGSKYKGWQRHYGIKKETRFPKIRNPKLKGSTCKHGHNVLQALPFHTANIVRDLRKLGVFSQLQNIPLASPRQKVLQSNPKARGKP